MAQTRIHLLCVLVLLTCAGCEQATDFQNGHQNVLTSSVPFITTDRDIYQVGTGHIEVAGQSVGYVDVTIQMTYTNRSSEPVYLATYCRGDRAYPPRLERLIDGQWELAYAQVTTLCGAVDYRVGPGETYDYEFRVDAYDPNARIAADTPWGPEVSSMGNAWRPPVLDGTYRVNWAYVVFGAPGSRRTHRSDEAPLDQRISNTFRLTGMLPWEE